MARKHGESTPPPRPTSQASAPREAPEATGQRNTLVIDIGGTGIKMLTVEAQGRPVNDRARRLTPQPASPDAVLAVCKEMVAEQPPFDRVSTGFPGVVVRGVVRTAPNLGTEAWQGFPLQERLQQMLGRPVRALNDADLQGYGVIQGQGVELVLTLGTGLGSALFTDGRLVPNLELGHHPFTRKKTYEERLGNAALEEVGREKWNRRVRKALAQMAPIFNYDVVYLGGGNAKKLEGELPANVRLFDNVEGLRGGIRLWESSE